MLEQKGLAVVVRAKRRCVDVEVTPARRRPAPRPVDVRCLTALYRLHFPASSIRGVVGSGWRRASQGGLVTWREQVPAENSPMRPPQERQSRDDELSHDAGAD